MIFPLLTQAKAGPSTLDFRLPTAHLPHEQALQARPPCKPFLYVQFCALPPSSLAAFALELRWDLLQHVPPVETVLHPAGPKCSTLQGLTQKSLLCDFHGG